MGFKNAPSAWQRRCEESQRRSDARRGQRRPSGWLTVALWVRAVAVAVSFLVLVTACVLFLR